MAETLGVKLSNLYHWFKRVGLDVRSLRAGLGGRDQRSPGRSPRRSNRP